MAKPKRSPKEELAIRRMLYDGVAHRDPIYDPDYHPKHMIAYFHARYVQVEDPERYATEHKLDHVMKPVRLPTLSGYAASIGSSYRTLWDWGKKFEAFQDACEQCKAMQLDMIVSLAACGAYNPNFAALMMKNLHEWADKVETENKGTLILQFDEQDEDA